LRAHQPGLAGALRYFEFGEGEPSAWRRFQRTLDRVLAGDADRARAVAGAQAMFAYFHRHLAAEQPA
ncbi:MAG TPA: biliverdin-producing heme oxygenase, partial [Xanthomonadaceae bacterium]|nr:biliverdin-producing heme oxygenase [Xanthomonadaceae bacterium]